jgi:hypothetical protein
MICLLCIFTIPLQCFLPSFPNSALRPYQRVSYNSRFAAVGESKCLPTKIYYADFIAQPLSPGTSAVRLAAGWRTVPTIIHQYRSDPMLLSFSRIFITLNIRIIKLSDSMIAINQSSSTAGTLSRRGPLNRKNIYLLILRFGLSHPAAAHLCVYIVTYFTSAGTLCFHAYKIPHVVWLHYPASLPGPMPSSDIILPTYDMHQLFQLFQSSIIPVWRTVSNSIIIPLFIPAWSDESSISFL